MVVVMEIAALVALETVLCEELADILDALEVEDVDGYGMEWGRGFAAGVRAALGHVRVAMGVPL